MKNVKRSYNKAPVNFYLVIISFSVYCLNQLFFKAQTNGWIHYLLQCHFNDVLAGLLLMSYSNFLLSIHEKAITKLHQIILYCLLVGLFWEYVIPLIKTNSVSDPIDILCYIIGGMIYWCFYRLTVRTTEKNRSKQKTRFTTKQTRHESC